MPPRCRPRLPLHTPVQSPCRRRGPLLCSHIVPKAVLFFTGEALDDGMDFEPEDGEGDEDDEDEEGDDERGGGMGSPFTSLAKTTGE